MTRTAALATAEGSDGAVTPHAFRIMMRQHAAGVAVITTRGGGRPVGFCATSLTSVSSQPATISFWVDASSVSGQAWRGAAHGIVHLLRSDQSEVASAFAVSGPAKFAGSAGWQWGPGQQPLLDDVLAWMLVRTRRRLIVGDHLLIVGEVREAAVQPGGPLIYHDRGFFGLTAISG